MTSLRSRRRIAAGYSVPTLGGDLVGTTLAYSFVNLRCLNLKSNQAHIYVGSGLTKDSVPLSEWNEILKKSETMLSALY